MYQCVVFLQLKSQLGRVDEKIESLINKSGEYVRTPKNYFSVRTVLVPKMDKNFQATEIWGAITLMSERFERRRMNVIDCGYKDCNNLDWGYII